MQDSGKDDSASSIVDAEGPGPQSAEAPEPKDKPFRPVSQMSNREFAYWSREANRLFPKVNRRYS
jgi:hypothetical protein